MESLAGLNLLREAGAPGRVLFLVGLGGRAEFWGAQMRALSGGFERAAFDHREGAESVEAIARDALALLDALGWESADLVGHSMGGAAAQWIAVHHPERVQRLVLSATWAGPTPFFRALFALRSHVLSACGAQAYLRLGMHLGHPAAWLAGDWDAAEAGLAARLHAFGGAQREVARMEAVVRHDLRERLGGVRAQTLVLCARDDAITPLPLSEELARRVPGARLVVLPSGGHFAPVAAAVLYSAHLREFLR